MSKTKGKGKSLLLAAAAAVATMLGTSAARPAQALTIQDLNSTVQIAPTSQSGVNSWSVDGVNQLAQEWFWFRVGSSGPQSSLDTLNLVGVPTPIDTNGNGTNNFVTTSYTTGAVTNPFTVTVTYNLTGGHAGSKTSDLSESIKITNTGSSALNFHFFQYSNFNLGGTPNNQNVSITGQNTATQTNPFNFTVSQTVVSPRANESEAGGGSPFPNLLNQLNTTNGLTLNNVDTATNTDASWAFQWDPILNPGQSFVISVDKTIRAVPEPESTVALLGLGGVFLARPRRRDEDPDPRTAQVAEA